MRRGGEGGSGGEVLTFVLSLASCAAPGPRQGSFPGCGPWPTLQLLRVGKPDSASRRAERSQSWCHSAPSYKSMGFPKHDIGRTV